MTTTRIAELCVDSLAIAEIITKEQFDRAAEIIEEEIRVRLSLGDTIEVETKQ